ncbi:MAG: rhodanese-like domain-containing protein [Legionella sp.]|nr:rhodanese-like domain-containing protein [Legionella sp.]
MEKLSQFITQHPLLWLAFTGILVLILINEFFAQRKKAKELTPQDAIDKINNDDAQVIDLRDKDSFNKSHIINSVQIRAEDLHQPKMNKYKNKPLILVCVRGVQSSQAAEKLRSQGHETMVLSGGITAWQNAGLPLVKGKN